MRLLVGECGSGRVEAWGRGDGGWVVKGRSVSVWSIFRSTWRQGKQKKHRPSKVCTWNSSPNLGSVVDKIVFNCVQTRDKGDTTRQGSIEPPAVCRKMVQTRRFSTCPASSSFGSKLQNLKELKSVANFAAFY